MQKFLKDNLRRAYKRAGDTQATYAEKHGITRAQFESYLRGLAEPSLELMAVICNEEKVSLYDFLFVDLGDRPLSAEHDERNNAQSERVRELEEKLGDAYKTIALMTQEKMKVHKESDAPLTKAAEGEALIKKKRKAG